MRQFTMMKTTVLGCAAAATLLLGSLAGCGSTAPSSTSKDKDTLVFAAIPSEQGQQLDKAYAATIKALEKALDVKIEFTPVNSNAGVIEGQVAKRVDLAVYGAFSYYLAASRADVEPIAAPIMGPGSEPGANSYGVVRSSEKSIKSLSDVRGKDICFTDPGSTTGYLQPLASLKEAGIDANKDDKVVFAGGHDTAVASLLAGDCDIAFVGDVFIDDILPAAGQLKPGQVRKVYESPQVPAPPVVVGDWLPKKQRDLIAKTLTSRTAEQLATDGFCKGSEIKGSPFWGDKAGVKACSLDASNGWTFVPVTAADYKQIDKICEVTKADVCTKGD
jgi:phosphonate transport system substrate-binding protein